MLKGENISFSYNQAGAEEKAVLKNISFEIREGDFIGLIGSSGSGKTTFVKHLNGLLKATSGTITYNGQNIYEKGYKLSNLRKEVGLVFQYPEHQLFGSTVLKDTMYGPRNLGMTDEEAEESAKSSLKLVGVDESYYYASPMELSGGQKRCVAIAGVLAMKPKILVLDEPAAGLDPETKFMIFDLIRRIQTERNIAIVLVSHHMEDVAQFANRVWVLHDGTLKMDDTPANVFAKVDQLDEMGIGVPQITQLTYELMKSGMPLPHAAISVDEAAKMLTHLLRKGANA